MFLACSSQHLAFSIFSLLPLMCQWIHILFSGNLCINCTMDSWFIKTGKSKLWKLCPTRIGLENFLIKVINWESPSWGLTQLTAWLLCFRTPPTYVKPVAAEAPMLIYVVGVMYMFIFSPLETIWILSDVRAITKVKSDSKESTDSKVGKTKFYDTEFWVINQMKWLLTQTSSFQIKNNFISIRWKGYWSGINVLKI